MIRFVVKKDRDQTKQTQLFLAFIKTDKFTVVYCESVNLISYITVCYLLIVNSYPSAHITHHV